MNEDFNKLSLSQILTYVNSCGQSIEIKGVRPDGKSNTYHWEVTVYGKIYGHTAQDVAERLRAYLESTPTSKEGMK